TVVNISSTTMSSLGTSVSIDAPSSLGTSVSSATMSSLGTSVSSDAPSSLGTSVSSATMSSLGTSVSSDAPSSLGTSVSSSTMSSLGTSVSSSTMGSLGTSVSSDAPSSLGTSVSSATMSSLGTSVSSATMGSLGTSVSSDAPSSLGTSVSSATMSSLGTSVSSDAPSSLGTSVSSATMSSLGTSISNTTLSDMKTSISMTTKLSSTTTASGPAGTTPVNISSTKFSALVAAVPNTTLKASGTSISNTTLSTIGTSTSLATNTSTTVSGADQVTGTTPVNISSTKFSALVAAVPNTTLKASGTSILNTTLSTIGTSTSLATNTSTTATTYEELHNEYLTVPQINCHDWNTSCMNNGNCTPEGTCLCPSSWTGRQCEYPCFPDDCPSEINVCIIDRKCNLNGTTYCNNIAGCFCFPGWYGSLCKISVCDNYPCYNGMKCRNDSGVAVCDCGGDAIGFHCPYNGSFSCHGIPSSARDHIISCINNKGYYTLVCKPEWTGKNCETPINITKFCSSNECDIKTLEYCNAVCERGNCSQNSYTTEGCKFAIGNPWNMCNTSNCIERFANGFCDSSCNNDDCLYDGHDCIDGKGFLQDCSPYFNTPCSNNLTFDGICNPECNTTDCLYDGFDCASSELTQLPGQLVIKVMMQPHSHMDKIIRKIGLLLRSGINKTFSTVLISKNNVFIAYLELTCSGLVNQKCFTSIQSAAKFLAAYVAKLIVPDLFVTDIFACEDGYYGDKGCNNKCSDGCKKSTNREICHKYSGECHDGCRDEYYGMTCNTNCNDNCGEIVGRRCNMVSGDCLYACKKNYYGQKCEQVCSNKCIDSCHQNGTCIGGCQGNLSYGFHCEKNCSKSCQNSTCDHLGKCHACVIGNHGDNCTEPCPDGCIEGCSQATGDCLKCNGNKCKADASYGQTTGRDPEKTDYTGVIVGVVASVFIIAAAILIAFLCWRRQQSGDYILGEDADTKTNANLEAVTTVQDQHSHMANFASSKDAVDLDEMHDNSVYVGRPLPTDDDELSENYPETTLGINNQFQPFVEIAFTADVDDSNEKFLNNGRVDWKQSPQDYAAETRDTDDQSSDDNEDVAVRTSGLLAAGGAPLAASEASLLSKDTLGEATESDNEPPQPDNEFMFEDGNLPQVTEADFNEENNSDEEEEEAQETQRFRSSSSSSSSSSDNN
ncbi:hypothetical protein ACJMK2_040718, partial [Sinanodonta woodiana]